VELNIFCIFTLIGVSIFKFLYGKSKSIKIKIIIKSYSTWFGIYHFVNTRDLKLTSFYMISNICNIIAGLAVCILVVKFIFSLSVI
jgi:hypothetical protein